MNATKETARASAGGVQSLHRALDLVEIVAGGGGHLTIGEIANISGLPQPTIHRLLRTLVERGFMRQLANRRYALGFRLIPLGAAANRMVGVGTESVLAELVREIGETANLAVLSGDHAEYVAQVPSSHAVRMFTEIGRRVELHCTGVGKALLAQLEAAEVDAIAQRVGLAAKTSHTLVTIADLHAALVETRDRGYAIDQEEQELGVRCVAVAVPSSGPASMALSVSGPLTRMDDATVSRAVPLLRAAADRLAAQTAPLDRRD